MLLRSYGMVMHAIPETPPKVCPSQPCGLMRDLLKRRLMLSAGFLLTLFSYTMETPESLHEYPYVDYVRSLTQEWPRLNSSQNLYLQTSEARMHLATRSSVGWRKLMFK